MQLLAVVVLSQASPSPRTKECSPATSHGPCHKPERTAQPRLLVREGAAHAGRPGPGACPIQRALAGNLEKRTPGPRACQCRGPPFFFLGSIFTDQDPITRHDPAILRCRTDLTAALPWREAMARFERHGSDLAARPNVAWGAAADPQGSCGTRPRGDRSWRCSTAQLRVRPGGSGCATLTGRCTRTLEYTAHCPDGDRPSGPIGRRAPTYTES